jgi:hypothetical protein
MNGGATMPQVAGSEPDGDRRGLTFYQETASRTGLKKTGHDGEFVARKRVVNNRDYPTLERGQRASTAMQGCPTSIQDDGLQWMAVEMAIHLERAGGHNQVGPDSLEDLEIVGGVKTDQ